MSTDELVLENADFVYSHSSEFTEEIVRRIPRRLIDSLDQGKEGFFDEFRQPMPKFYKALIENVDHVYLMENINVYIRPNNSRKETKYYRWGFQCMNKLITSEIPLELSEIIKTMEEQEYLPCIPPELHCFYKKTDGMTITDEFGVNGFDLPVDSNDWFEVYDYFIEQRTEYNISMTDVRNLYKEFANGKLKILFQGSLRDVIFFDFSAKDRKLYHIKNYNLSDYQLIKNAPQVLDSYFANAVLGFPQHINLS